MKVKSLTYLNPYLFSFILFGYGYVGLLVTDSSQSQQLTIPYRLSVLCIASTILLARSVFASKESKLVKIKIEKDSKMASRLNNTSALNKKFSKILILIFIAIYSIKFFFDVYGSSLFYGSYVYYLSFWFLICLLPGTTFSLIDWSKPWIYLLSSQVTLAGLSLLMLSRISTLQNSSFIAHGRFAGAALNPILLGAFSGLSILISVYALLSSKLLLRSGVKKKQYRFVSVSCILSLPISSYFLIASASRGPMLSTLLCLAILLLCYANKRPLYTIISSALGLFLVLEIILPFIQAKGLISLERLWYFNENYEGSRVDLLNRSVELFLANDYNFFVGYGVEIPNYGYPHNVIVESFVSTGFFGGCLFTLICIITLAQSMRLLVYFKLWGWIGLLFIFNFLLALISGSLYGSYFFWYLLFAVNGLCTRLSVSNSLLHKMRDTQKVKLPPLQT